MQNERTQERRQELSTADLDLIRHVKTEDSRASSYETLSELLADGDEVFMSIQQFWSDHLALARVGTLTRLQKN